VPDLHCRRGRACRGGLNDEQRIREAQLHEAGLRHEQEVARDWRPVVRRRLAVVMAVVALWSLAIVRAW